MYDSDDFDSKEIYQITKLKNHLMNNNIINFNDSDTDNSENEFINKKCSVIRSKLLNSKCHKKIEVDSDSESENNI